MNKSSEEQANKEYRELLEKRTRMVMARDKELKEKGVVIELDGPNHYKDIDDWFEAEIENIKKTFNRGRKWCILKPHWAQRLNSKERLAIKKYTKNWFNDYPPKFYERLNRMLRNGTHNRKLEEYANIISGALKKQPLQNDIICFRNVSVDPFNGYGIGDIAPGKQFFSTSVLEEAAIKSKYHIVIYAPKGTHGAYIEKISGMPEQLEFLIDKDCMYRILSRKGKTIVVEVVV